MKKLSTDLSGGKALPELSLDEQMQMIASAACGRAVFISDEEDRIIFWSNGAEDCLGFSMMEARGKTLQTLAGDSALDAAQITLALKPRSFDARVSLWLRHKNQERLWCSLSSDSVKNGRGQTFFVNFLTDLTELRNGADSI